MSDLKPLDFDSLYAKLEKQGLSGRTVKHVHVRLVTAFQQALKWELLSSSPVARATAPKVVKKEMDYLSPEEAQKFITATRADARGVLLRFALLTGLRPEEYCGLKWADLDISKGRRAAGRAC